MNIPQIAQKYRISEAFLNSKDDALMIAAESLKDLQAIINSGVADPKDIVSKLQFLQDFLTDVKSSGY